MRLHRILFCFVSFFCLFCFCVVLSCLVLSCLMQRVTLTSISWYHSEFPDFTYCRLHIVSLKYERKFTFVYACRPEWLSVPVVVKCIVSRCRQYINTLVQAEQGRANYCSCWTNRSSEIASYPLRYHRSASLFLTLLPIWMQIEKLLRIC